MVQIKLSLAFLLAAAAISSVQVIAVPVPTRKDGTIKAVVDGAHVVIHKGGPSTHPNILDRFPKPPPDILDSPPPKPNPAFKKLVDAKNEPKRWVYCQHRF